MKSFAWKVDFAMENTMRAFHSSYSSLLFPEPFENFHWLFPMRNSWGWSSKAHKGWKLLLRLPLLPRFLIVKFLHAQQIYHFNTPITFQHLFGLSTLSCDSEFPLSRFQGGSLFCNLSSMMTPKEVIIFTLFSLIVWTEATTSKLLAWEPNLDICKPILK